MSGEQTPYEAGLDSAQGMGRYGDWRDNPHSPGTSDWFRFEDGRRDGGADDVGPSTGLPSWA